MTEEERWIETEALNDDNDDEPLVGDLFADPDPYDEFRFEFPGNIHIVLSGVKAENGQTLKSTGLTLWRASPLLCEYMVSQQEWLKQKIVLELGAGLGLCGILAHFLGAKRVVLTDGDTDTLKAMRSNVAANISNGMVECRQLRWGQDMDAFSSCGFHVILASDVIYVQDILEPLFDTVVQLLSKDEGSRFWLSYARRNVSIDLVLECAQQHGLQWNELEDKEGVFVFERTRVVGLEKCCT